MGTASLRPPSSVSGTTAGLIPPAAWRISPMMSVISSRWPWDFQRGSRNSLVRVMSGGAPTSRAAVMRVAISPPGTFRICNSWSFTPACLAYARICSSRSWSAVALKFGCGQNASL